MSSTLPADPVNSAHYVWYQRFASNLKSAVGDKIVVNYFPSDQLGKEADVVQQVRLGSVDMMISGSSIWATLMPEMGVLDMGYLFANNDHCGRALDAKGGTILADMLLERTSVQALGWCYSLGARNVFTKNPVKTADDLHNVKLRVLPVPNFVATLKYMGAVPTPLPFGEIYTSLQTGVVDGFEHDAPTALAGKFYEVAKQLRADAAHLQSAAARDQQALAVRASRRNCRSRSSTPPQDANLYQRGKAQEAESNAFDKLKAGGLTVYTVDRAALQKKVEPLWGEFAAKYPSVKPVVDEIQATRT